MVGMARWGKREGWFQRIWWMLLDGFSMTKRTAMWSSYYLSDNGGGWLQPHLEIHLLSRATLSRTTLLLNSAERPAPIRIRILPSVVPPLSPILRPNALPSHLIFSTKPPAYLLLPQLVLIATLDADTDASGQIKRSSDEAITLIRF